MKKIKFKPTRFHIVLMLLIFGIVFLTIRIKLNEKLIKDLSANKFDYGISRVLKVVNISEGYIAYYNAGNIYYQDGKYKEAESNYESALKRNVPYRRVCDVRVNLGLAKLAQIDENTSEDDKTRIVYDIINILDGDDCSTNDFHSKTFKEELLQQQGGGSGSGSNSSGGGAQGEDEQEQQLEQQLEQQQAQAQATQESETTESQNLSNYSYYDGQQW